MFHSPVAAAEKRQALRAGLGSGRLLRYPGAFNPLSALLIERMGFEGVYISGAVVAASLALPDIGLTTLSEVAARSHEVARTTGLPTLVDADTGFGEPLSAARTVHVLEDLGISGCHIEDQVNPKRCGHLEGKEIVAVADMRPARQGGRRGPAGPGLCHMCPHRCPGRGGPRRCRRPGQGLPRRRGRHDIRRGSGRRGRDRALPPPRRRPPPGQYDRVRQDRAAGRGHPGQPGRERRDIPGYAVTPGHGGRWSAGWPRSFPTARKRSCWKICSRAPNCTNCSVMTTTAPSTPAWSRHELGAERRAGYARDQTGLGRGRRRHHGRLGDRRDHRGTAVPRLPGARAGRFLPLRGGRLSHLAWRAPHAGAAGGVHGAGEVRAPGAGP